MKRLLLAGPFLAVLVVAQQAAGPQRNSAPTPKKSTQSATTPRPAVPIGNNIVQVIDTLVAAGAARGKGEYETTKDFNLRISALSSRYGQLAFLIPEKITASFEYDADGGEMKVSLSAEAKSDGSGDDDIRVSALSGLVQKPSYAGKNPYGIETAARKVNYFEYGVRIGPDSPALASVH